MEKLFEEIKNYIDNATPEELNKDWEKFKKFNKGGVKIKTDPFMGTNGNDFIYRRIKHFILLIKNKILEFWQRQSMRWTENPKNVVQLHEIPQNWKRNPNW